MYYNKNSVRPLLNTASSLILQSITRPIRRIKPSPLQTSDLDIVQTVVGNFVFVNTFKSDCIIFLNNFRCLCREESAGDRRHIHHVLLGAGNRQTLRRGRSEGAAVPALGYNAAIGIILSKQEFIWDLSSQDIDKTKSDIRYV